LSCLAPTREKYFAHMDFAVQDIPRTRAVSVHSAPEVPKTPYFKIKQVRRMAKLEDEDDEFMREINARSASEHLLPQQDCSYNAARSNQGNRTRSLHSQASYSSLPRAARQHRPSWSRQDYSGPMSLGRQRALSDVQTPTRKESNETIDRRQSPFSTYQSRPDTPTLSSSA